MVEFQNIFTDLYELRQEDGQESSILLSVNVPIIDRATCMKNYASQGVRITNNMLCAGFAAGILLNHILLYL